MNLSFDQVSVKVASGYNMMRAADFMTLPLVDRANMVTQGRVQFLRGGQPVSMLEAVKSMKAAA